MAKRNDNPKVYLAAFPNGKLYVGITTATLEIRKYEHESRARNGSNYAIHNAIRKYGNPKWEVLNICSSFEEAKELERKYIKELNSMSPNGYNLTEGGDGSKGHKFSEEQRRKLSEAHKGYVMPESQKLAISAGNKGKKRSAETIEKIKKAQTGKILSEEHLANVRKASCVSVEVFEKDTNEFVGKWDSITDCAKALNLSRTAISNCLNGRAKSTGNYVVRG